MVFLILSKAEPDSVIFESFLHFADMLLNRPCLKINCVTAFFFSTVHYVGATWDFLRLFNSVINDHADRAGLSQHKLCMKYKVSKGVVYNILQRKYEYKDDFKINANICVKRKLQNDSGHKIDETEGGCLLFKPLTPTHPHPQMVRVKY